jgi:serine/threonine protein kinase
MAVKFGRPVYEEEARNQRHAHSILDPTIVRVPEVYHYFRRDNVGYLVMEYIEGERCPNEVGSDIIDKVANIVTHLRTHHGTIPGPVGGGIVEALLFENEPIAIQDLADLETYFNDRLLGERDPVKFEESELVFCHNDIAPRNIIFCKDGTLSLIDWAHAGYFPRCFESVTMWFNTGGGNHVDFSYAWYERSKPSKEEAEKEDKVHTGWWHSHCRHM